MNLPTVVTSSAATIRLNSSILRRFWLLSESTNQLLRIARTASNDIRARRDFLPRLPGSFTLIRGFESRRDN